MMKQNDEKRRYRKRELQQAVKLLIKANDAMESICRKNPAQAQDLFIQCQQSAILLGENIEKLESRHEELLKSLEEYCENIYLMSEAVLQENKIRKLSKKIQRQLVWIYDRVCCELPKEKREVVFLPYKASMWDSMESIWKAADRDDNTDAYVIPIPYFDKNPDGRFGKLHYEGELYPQEVPVMEYHKYDFETRRPDVIFIHNPYDEQNYVTSVLPFFFSENLKKYTDKLVYVPYYVVPGAITRNFVFLPGVLHADLVFVQSERIRKQYIQFLKEGLDLKKLKGVEEKVVAFGSPKTDKLIFMQKNKPEIPKEWKEQIGNRKVVFFNTNVSLLLHNGSYFMQNLWRIFGIFKTFRKEFVLLWREHPLTLETLQSMRPELLEDYLKLKQEFQEKAYGILDESEEPIMAMAISDCYFGAGGSLVAIYSVSGKPMMLTAYHYPEEISDIEITKEGFYASLGSRTYYKEGNSNALSLFLENYEEIAAWKEHRIKLISKNLKNLDGTVGEKIYDYVIATKEEEAI